MSCNDTGSLLTVPRKKDTAPEHSYMWCGDGEVHHLFLNTKILAASSKQCAESSRNLETPR